MRRIHDRNESRDREKYSSEGHQVTLVVPGRRPIPRFMTNRPLKYRLVARLIV